MPLPPSKHRNRIKLSRQDMCGISQAISRDFSPRFFRSRTANNANAQFSAQELLEISQQISREHPPCRDSHQPRLVLLAVSPKRLHAYWHVTKQRLTQALKRIEQQQPMTLRIYTEATSDAEEPTQNQTETSWFDVAIASEDGHQDIYLPDTIPASPPVQYRAVLGKVQNDHVFVPLTYSNVTAAPHAATAHRGNELVNATTAFIMPEFIPAWSAGKTASGQGKQVSQ